LNNQVWQAAMNLAKELRSMNSDTARILIVDDEDNDVFLLRTAMEWAGLTNPVEVACNGRQAIDHLGDALEKTQSLPFLIRLVLLDLKMPGLNGFDVLRWRLGQPALLNVPFVVLTSSDLDCDREQSLELGAAEYRVKPREIHELVLLLKQLKDCWLSGPAAGTYMDHQSRFVHQMRPMGESSFLTRSHVEIR